MGNYFSITMLGFNVKYAIINVGRSEQASKCEQMPEPEPKPEPVLLLLEPTFYRK